MPTWCDPRLADFVRRQVEDHWHVPVQITAASLRAGTRCCEKNPSLHFRAPQVPFQQAAPTFTEDILIPWEGNGWRRPYAVASTNIAAGQEVKFVCPRQRGPRTAPQIAAR